MTPKPAISPEQATVALDKIRAALIARFPWLPPPSAWENEAGNYNGLVSSCCFLIDSGSLTLDLSRDNTLRAHIDSPWTLNKDAPHLISYLHQREWIENPMCVVNDVEAWIRVRTEALAEERTFLSTLTGQPT